MLIWTKNRTLIINNRKVKFSFLTILFFLSIWCFLKHVQTFLVYLFVTIATAQSVASTFLLLERIRTQKALGWIRQCTSINRMTEDKALYREVYCFYLCNTTFSFSYYSLHLSFVVRCCNNALMNGKLICFSFMSRKRKPKGISKRPIPFLRRWLSFSQR